MRVRHLLPSVLLLLATPTTTQAQPDSRPTIHWSRCVQHLDWATATHITAQTCRRYPIHARQTYGAWSRCTRQSPHVRICVRCPYRRHAVMARVRGYAARYLVTMYSLCSSGALMADGQTVHYGAAAASLPFGTRISVPGLWPVVVEDRVGFAPYLHVDVWTSSCAWAVQWGSRYETVFIYQ